MKAYMAFDRVAGPAEAAMLVFADTARDARKLSYGFDWHWGAQDAWINWTAKLIKDLPSELKALDLGIPQVVSSPPVCKRCELWGGHPKGPGCSMCVEDWELTA